MKKIAVICLAFVGLFAACSSSELETPGQELRLIACVSPQTRGTDLKEQSTLIKEGQQVGITITGSTSVHNNVPWVTQADGELNNSQDPVYFTDHATLSIQAYHPYQETWTDLAHTTYNFCVQANQTAEGYAQSDFLYATTQVSAANTAVNLHFQHLMAKVVVNFTTYLGSDMEISILNTKLSAQVRAGQVTVKETSTPTAILAGQGYSAAALVVPQTLTAGTAFLQFRVTENGESKTYTYSLPEDRTFMGGQEVTFNIGLENVLPDFYYEEF